MSRARRAPDPDVASGDGGKRARVVESLFKAEDSDARDMVAQLEDMARDSDQITHSESEKLARESQAARVFDQQLAGDLGQRRLGGETSSAGFLRELGARPGLSHTQVGEMLALERVPRSMEDPVRGAQGELGAFGELLVDPLAAHAYEELLDHSEIEQSRALLVSLNDRERMVLRARYGLDGPEQSLRDVGERIGLSAERVRQIEQRALGTLRAAGGRATA